MMCTGEVRLTKGNPEEGEEFASFKDWGIEIRVSFREGLKPQVLSARVQSGGERSVSTIMYLMAMQGMMVSPFRCVDEINQGLDERNERLVFRRIVENSTKEPGPKGPTDHSGQYFLITPKLLPNLYDMEVEAMTLLFIFNGEYIMSCCKGQSLQDFSYNSRFRTIQLQISP
jgi:chromosome segregation ATPase